MGVGCGLKVAGETHLDGIIVGSGIGCYQNSITFTGNYLTKSEGALSPTSFIQSTDNAIAGQIAIALQNHGYNNTYIHKGIAFENALIDALLLMREGKKDVLVGAVDEWITLFKNDQSSEEWVGEGSSFFLLSSNVQQEGVVIREAWVLESDPGKIEKEILNFLADRGLSQPKLILEGRSFTGSKRLAFHEMKVDLVSYSDHSGIYFTNAAFALQLAFECLKSEHNDLKLPCKGPVLIVNNFNDQLFGLIYVEKV
jgi:hypothetical protein